MANREFLPGHSVKFVRGGEAYFKQLIDVIDECKVILHLQVYIFDFDETGKRVFEALKNAVKRGVNVYLVVDGFGSSAMEKSFDSSLSESGVFFRVFSPLPFPGILQAGRRLHHKVCVADHATALVGGINIADKYRGTTIVHPWLDYALLVKGQVCNDIHFTCERIFNKQFSLDPRRKFSIPVPFVKDGEVAVRMSRNDWFRGKREISTSYKRMLRTAQSDILIVASYFIPSRKILKILETASNNGRSVTVVLSKYSDVPFIKPAMTFLYDRLFRGNIKIFEYNEAVLHAKVCVVDKKWVSVGSLNLNNLSELISIEMNLEVLDVTFGNEVATELKELINQHCTEVTLSVYERSNHPMKRLSNWFSYKMISWSLSILFFLNRKDPKG